MERIICYLSSLSQYDNDNEKDFIKHKDSLCFP